MASLLPALPAEWPHDTASPRHPQYLRSHSAKTADRCSATSRWGTEKSEYGGVGGAADHVIPEGGSRSHRHYGSGIHNYLAHRQPYQVTTLLLSDSRPCDQLLPPPLLTNRIIQHRQSFSYPANDVYTSHRSKFALFPLVRSHRLTAGIASPLTLGTCSALNQISHAQFCTTYQHTFTNPWTSTEPRSTSTNRAEVSEREKEEENNNIKFSGEKEGDLSNKDDENEEASRLSAAGLCDVGAVDEGQSSNGCHSDGSGSTRVKKRVHWQDDQPEEEKEEEEEEVKETEKVDEGKENDEELAGESNCRDGRERGERDGVVAAEREEETGRDVIVAASLPQLPQHFRRVSEKYCRNHLSPIWPCSIPHYLCRPHSRLECHIPRTAELPEVETVAMPTKNADAEKHDVIGESPPPLSAMLHVSGSRIPYRLGTRFKSQAHSRYHQLYPDKVPDLRSSHVESKKYFFFGVHSSVLR